MKIGLVEKILIALSITVVVASMVFALNSRPEADRVAVLKTLGMTCGSCAASIERLLITKPGVVEVKVSVEAARVAVGYDSKFTGAEMIAVAATEAGYRSAVVEELTVAQFRERHGDQLSSMAQSKKGGCGSGCCN